MNEEQAKKLFEVSLWKARSKGFGEWSFDIAQEIVLDRLEGKRKRQRVDQGVVDAARRLLGDERNEVGKMKAQSCEIREEDHPVVEIEENDFKRMVSSVHGVDRAILILFYQWGYTYGEIADLFGVSELDIRRRIVITQSEIKKGIK